MIPAAAIDLLGRTNGLVRGGHGEGRPSLARDVHLAEAILAPSGHHLAGVVGQRDRRAALLPVRRQCRAQEAVAHATFGTMVWVFQLGNLSGLLGFTATGALNTSMLIRPRRGSRSSSRTVACVLIHWFGAG
jgi:hypothetical protein